MRLNSHDVNLGHPGLEHRSHFGNEPDKSAMSDARPPANVSILAFAEARR